MSLIGRTSLITGGSRGIGLAVGKKLAKNGSNVILLARSKDALVSAVGELPVIDPRQKHYGVIHDVQQAMLFTSDLANQNLCTSSSKALAGDLSLESVDHLINSAGLSQESLLLRSQISEIQSLLNVNLFGSIIMAKSLLRSLIKRRRKYHGCSITNISSILAEQPTPGTSVYAAAKAGINAFTKSLAAEIEPTGVRVNSITLGLVDTNMAASLTHKATQNLLGETGVILSADKVAQKVYEIICNEQSTGKTYYMSNQLDQVMD